MLEDHFIVVVEYFGSELSAELRFLLFSPVFALYLGVALRVIL